MIIGFDGRYAEGDLVGVGKFIQNLVSRVAKKGLNCIVFYSREPKVKIPGVKSVVLNSLNRYHFEQVLLPLVSCDRERGNSTVLPRSCSFDCSRYNSARNKRLFFIFPFSLFIQTFVCPKT